MVSCPMWDGDLSKWIRKHYPEEETTILDIGAGNGKYRRLLGDYYDNMDAVEIWDDYIPQLKERDKYRYVFHCDARKFKFTEKYDIVIMGDVLEHMTIEDGQKLIDYILQNTRELIVVVPYMYPQHALYGNTYEIHLQPDLTPDNVTERYPQLHMLYSRFNPNVGFKGIGVFISTLPKNSDMQIIT